MHDHGRTIDGDLAYVFLLVCQLGGYKKAAERLDVDRSTVKKKILRLERIVGEKLFERGVGSLKITKKGQLIAREASRFLCAANSFAHAIEANPADHIEPLTISCPEDIFEICVSEVLFTSLIKTNISSVAIRAAEDHDPTASISIFFDRQNIMPSARLIAKIEYALFASKTYTLQNGSPSEINCSPSQTVILHPTTDLDFASTVRGSYAKWITTVFVNNTASKIRGIERGVGFGIMPNLRIERLEVLEKFPITKNSTRMLWMSVGEHHASNALTHDLADKIAAALQAMVPQSSTLPSRGGVTRS